MRHQPCHTAKPPALGESQRLCLRPVPLQVEPAEQVVLIVSLPGRSVRHEKYIPARKPSRPGFHSGTTQIVTISLACDVRPELPGGGERIHTRAKLEESSVFTLRFAAL
jgi:hypothetical protein